MLRVFLGLIFLGSIFRFYGLLWGQPFFFHPDERNIASSIGQLNFPQQMNPHFFAYGSFPIYVVYFVGILSNIFSYFIHQTFPLPNSALFVSFEQTILISRFLSAFLSTLIIPLIYLVGKRLGGKTVGFLSAAFSVISVGFIQFAHFGTFEVWLTFLALLLFYFCLKITEKMTIKNIIILGLLLGLLIGTKISSLVLLPLPILSVFLNLLSTRSSLKHSIRLILPSLSKTFPVLVIALLTFIIASPFALLDFSSFLSSIKYESSVALGTLPVFYTDAFYHTTPVFFQFTKIYPFLLNPLITFFFIPSLMYVTLLGFKKKNISYYLLFTIYCLLFLPQAFFFAKWTRYMVPTLPFIYLIVAIAISNFLEFAIKALGIKYFKYLLLSMIFFISSIFAFSYFATAYLRPDTRIQAALWAKKHISSDAKILSEVYDLGITPFNPFFPKIRLFNFYDLDQIPQKKQELLSELKTFDHLVLPSQRVLKSRLLRPKKFPNGYDFYKMVSKGLGFEKVYETPCDIFCKITYLNNPIYSFEETASVFDRPTLFIFKINY